MYKHVQHDRAPVLAPITVQSLASWELPSPLPTPWDEMPHLGSLGLGHRSTFAVRNTQGSQVENIFSCSMGVHSTWEKLFTMR
jgi:hypothetical protein